MKLSDLTKYAEEKYQIKENFSLTNSPNYSVLVHPQSQRWIALLIREYDKDGNLIEKCDLKNHSMYIIPYHDTILSHNTVHWWAHIIHSDDWIGIEFSSETNNEVVFNLFDTTIEIENDDFQSLLNTNNYEDGEYVVEKTNENLIKLSIIHKMQQLYKFDYAPFVFDIYCKSRNYSFDYAMSSFKGKNFYTQGKFMEDYVDDVPWKTVFRKQYPTYYDMNVAQLREYFSWRTKIRNGIFEKTSVSFAYVYLFELLNSIGTQGIEDAFNKLVDFENNYSNTKLGTPGLSDNNRLWIFGFAIVNGLSKDIANKYVSNDILEKDSAFEVLLHSDNSSDYSVFLAMETIIEHKINSCVVKKYKDIGVHCFAKIFRLCFDKISEIIIGKMVSTRFEPYLHVPYWIQEEHQDCIYELNSIRSYVCRNGLWTQNSYSVDYNKQSNLSHFIHTIDLRLRLLFQTGYYLKENEEDVTFFPYVDNAIKVIIEELKPKFAPNFFSFNKKNKGKEEKSLLDNEKNIPSEIKRMLDLYNDKYDFSQNFYKQGKFMENYTDDVPWEKSLKTNYPNYHDLDVMQLRQYFTWRTKLRNGILEYISAPFARIYIFELLNFIGTQSVNETLSQLIDFYEKYVVSFGSMTLQKNIKEWIFGFVIVHNLSKDIAIKYTPDDILSIDILLDPSTHEDCEIMSSFETIIGDAIPSIVFKKQGQKGIHFFAEIWKICCNKIRKKIFGDTCTSSFDPFPHVPYYPQVMLLNHFYVLNKVRKYYYEDGHWFQKSYMVYYYTFYNVKDYIHAVDLKLRLYFNTGNFLKEKKSDYEFFPFIDEAIEIIKEDLKPQIAINISSLNKIRKDSDETRDNLLTEEDMADEIIKPSEIQDDSELEMLVLKALLNGENANDFIKNKHLIPSVIADKINEMFIDEIGDSIVEYDGSKLSIIEDYREEIVDILNQTTK